MQSDSSFSNRLITVPPFCLISLFHPKQIHTRPESLPKIWLLPKGGRKLLFHGKYTLENTFFHTRRRGTPPLPPPEDPPYLTGWYLFPPLSGLPCSAGSRVPVLSASPVPGFSRQQRSLPFTSRCMPVTLHSDPPSEPGALHGFSRLSPLPEHI